MNKWIIGVLALGCVALVAATTTTMRGAPASQEVRSDTIRVLVTVGEDHSILVGGTEFRAGARDQVVPIEFQSHLLCERRFGEGGPICRINGGSRVLLVRSTMFGERSLVGETCPQHRHTSTQPLFLRLLSRTDEEDQHRQEENRPGGECNDGEKGCSRNRMTRLDDQYEDQQGREEVGRKQDSRSVA